MGFIKVDIGCLRLSLNKWVDRVLVESVSTHSPSLNDYCGGYSCCDSGLGNFLS